MLGLEELLRDLPQDHLAKRELVALRSLVKMVRSPDWKLLEVDALNKVQRLREEAVASYQAWIEQPPSQ